jgi:hypothetical protein
MARLKKALKIKEKYNVNDFIAEHKGGAIFNCRYLDGGELILVEEWIKTDRDPLLFWTFFNAVTLDKIDSKQRYLNENNKQWQEQLNDTYMMTSLVVVNKENGCESVIEQTFEDSICISNIKKIRYLERRMSKLEEIAFVKNTKHEKCIRKDDFIYSFLNGDANKKFIILNTAFNKTIRSHSESGFEPVESFLYRPIYNEIKDDPLFEITLRKVLEYNSKWLNKDVSMLYSIVMTNILELN